MKVKSSFIADVEFKEKSNVLTVTFRSGTRYAYKNFTKQKFARFKNAKSKSSYFATMIRGKYESKKLKPV